MRIGVIIIFHLSKLWKGKFSILCDVIFLEAVGEIGDWSLLGFGRSTSLHATKLPPVCAREQGVLLSWGIPGTERERSGGKNLYVADIASLLDTPKVAIIQCCEMHCFKCWPWIFSCFKRDCTICGTTKFFKFIPRLDQYYTILPMLNHVKFE